jgi:sarcosine oxidase subunit beta
VTHDHQHDHQGDDDLVDGCDVAIVGAGIIGASCAHQLAAAGLEVIVLDRNEAPAMGSTGLSAAGVRVQFVEPTNVALSLASIREYAAFEERYGVDSGYRSVGYLLLVPEQGWEEHLHGVEVQRSLEAPVEVLDLDTAQERFAAFDPTGLAGATFGPIDGVVDPYTVTQTYLSVARRHGATVRLRSEVTAIAHVGDRWELTVGGRRLRTGIVVNAAGCWAGEVGRLAGLDVPVEPFRRIIYLTAPAVGRATTPLTVDLSTGLYFRSEGERLLFGRSNPDQAPGFATGMDPDWLEPTLTAAMDRFPWFADEQLDLGASWSGFYEMTPDHNALLGASPDAPGWVDACGFSGHGVQHAAAVGRAIREEIVDGRATTIDIDPLRPERLRSGRHRAERHII